MNNPPFQRYSTWSSDIMMRISKLTPDIKGKAWDPDWFLLRERLEEAGSVMERLLTFNGGPIDAEDTTDGQGYVMVRRIDFDALEIAVNKAKTK